MSPSTQTKPDNESGSVFLDNEVLEQIYGVINYAAVGITLVTPYLTLWEHLKTKIEDAKNRKIDISFVIRDFENDKHAQKRPIDDLKWLMNHGVKVIEVPNLHAKIYLNEKTVLVSSMNITAPSVTNSREFVMIVKNEDDAKTLRAYVGHVIEKFGPASAANSTGHQAAKYAPTLIQKFSSNSEHSAGMCIRCGKKMDFNEERPLCGDCYQKWAKFKNKDYVEKYCHLCGKVGETTYAKPLDRNCWIKEHPKH